MWKQVLGGSAALVLVVGMAGCKSNDMSGSADKGQMMSKSDMDNMMTVASSDQPAMMTAPMDGTYMLCAGSRCLTSVTLKKGDPIGFMMKDGKNMAMAGDKSMDVTGMHAMWQHGMQK